jgi:hypothetical protein
MLATNRFSLDYFYGIRPATGLQMSVEHSEESELAGETYALREHFPPVPLHSHIPTITGYGIDLGPPRQDLQL